MVFSSLTAGGKVSEVQLKQDYWQQVAELELECMRPVKDIQENTTDRSVVSRFKEKLLSAGARRFCFRCQKFRF